MGAGPPPFHIVGGSPTPEEEAAIREAILRLWRDDQAAARRSSERSGWVVAARAEAAGYSGSAVRGDSGAWRLAPRLPGFGLVSERRAGRGDSK